MSQYEEMAWASLNEHWGAEHRLIAVLEKMMNQVGPAGSAVSVKSVAKALPYVGILIGAGANSRVLHNVAADAKRYCQTRFLCEKYGVEMPTALTAGVDEGVESAETE